MNYILVIGGTLVMGAVALAALVVQWFYQRTPRVNDQIDSLNAAITEYIRTEIRPDGWL